MDWRIGKFDAAKGMDVKEKDMIYLACSRALKIKSMGCHCSQACLCAIASYVGLDEGEAMKLSAAFGGGMRHQQLCGAVAGAGIALGLAFGTEKYDQAASDRLGALTVEFVDRFTKELGTSICGPILAHPLEAFSWDMPVDMACDSACQNENGNLFNLKAPACGAAITNAVRFTLEIIQRESGLKPQC